MGDSNKLAASDDEEDLEALRQAALQSLKKKNEIVESLNQPRRGVNTSPEKRRFNRSLKGMQNKRGRFFGNHAVRGAKNAQFNNRVRNTNLISIPTIPSEHNSDDKQPNENNSILTLPQDRYCGKERKEGRNEEDTSKFTRYDKSDESDSESEMEEAASSEEGSPGKLKKADSLEALMEELDAEIQGKTIIKGDKPVKEEKSKKKAKNKKRTSSEAVSTSDTDVKAGEQKDDKSQCDTNVEVVKHTSENAVSQSDKQESKQEQELGDSKRKIDETYSPVRKRLRSRSPVHRRGFNRRRRGNFQKFPNRPPPNIPFVPPPTQYPPPIIPFPGQPFNPMFCPAPIISQPPPFYERPVSPLTINTESLTTATLAPLSPRSAAFVLENKAIIERRKRSPRRSYSRSLSRSPRRSLTPRRSPRRSITPRRLSRSPRRLSRSPRRRSLSPRRRSLSPRRKNVGKSTDSSPKSKAPVRERLGVKLNKTEENKEKPKDASPKKEEKTLDPVLEARKRKFESNEIKMKEGIIRLKPKEERMKESAPLPVPFPTAAPITPPKEKPVQKEEKPVKKEEKRTHKEEKHTQKTEEGHVPPQEEQHAQKEEKLLAKKEEVTKPKVPDEFEELERLLNEDVLLGSDDIDTVTQVDIFSDEDSASDNEGRFKVKQQVGKKPPILSFTKLINGEKKEIKQEPLLDPKRRERRSNRSDRRRSRARTPSNRKDTKENLKEVNKKLPQKKVETQEKEKSSRSRVPSKSDRHAPPMEKRFDRKIEIKIKNPSKYERGGKLKFSKESGEKTLERVKRKVELGCNKEEEEEEVEPEIVVENESGDDENSAVSEGDLRAQLSKKRAEKLQRIPIEGVSSRLLQSALQGAVFKESKKKTKDQDISSSDGKLPVYLRLGIANNTDIFTDTKVKRKSRKRKNREVLEQLGMRAVDQLKLSEIRNGLHQTG